MKQLCQLRSALFMSVILFFQTACGTLAAASTASPMSAVPVGTTIPLSQQVVLTFISFKEQGQAPVYTISAQTPVLSGAEDARIQAFKPARAPSGLCLPP